VIFEASRPYNLGKPRVIPLGPITDISRQGLSVEYTPHKSFHRKFQELSILVPGQGVAVYRIPFRDISNIAVPDSTARQPVMRRGMQFLGMNDLHAGQLEDFIAAYTRDVVPDRRSGYERRGVAGHSPESHAAIQQADGAVAELRSGRDRRGAGL
jgi:hypothetical protein